MARVEEAGFSPFPLSKPMDAQDSAADAAPPPTA
jgi:hypothetical protein